MQTVWLLSSHVCKLSIPYHHPLGPLPIVPSNGNLSAFVNIIPLPPASSYGTDPQPFQISVSTKLAAASKLKAGLTRHVHNMDIPDFEDGVPQEKCVRHSRLLDEVIRPGKRPGGFERQVQTIRHDSRRWGQSYISSSASLCTLPIIASGCYFSTFRLWLAWLFHGSWEIIDTLTNLPKDSVPAFHVVALSVPGFAFSPARNTGLGLREAGQGFNDLMRQLGHGK